MRCDICGRFVRVEDIASGAVMHRLVTPDSAHTAETWETYHRACEAGRSGEE